jgi:hypothetical protein
MPPYTNQQQYINEDKIDPNTDNVMIFAILQFYTGYKYYRNDDKISLHIKSVRLIFMIYSV